MRKAIASFEQDFAQWGLTLPARDVVDRQPGHLSKHGWSIDYSFGEDAFGEFLEYHARRVITGEPAAERHTRVYHNGERNFVPAPEPAAGRRSAGATVERPAGTTGDAAGADDSPHHRATLPPWEVIMQEATGARPSARSPFRDKVRAMANARFSSAPGQRGTTRIAPREDPPSRGAPEPLAITSRWELNRRAITSLAIGIGGALALATILMVAVRIVRARRAAHTPAAAIGDSTALPPVVVVAPEVVSFRTDSSASRITQPLVGTPRDANRAEIVSPDHGMTPIIPTDPKTQKKTRPAPTSHGEKFHVP